MDCNKNYFFDEENFYRHTQIVTVYCIAQFPVEKPRRDYTLEEKDQTKVQRNKILPEYSRKNLSSKTKP
jgi:hypothetical protein